MKINTKLGQLKDSGTTSDTLYLMSGFMCSDSARKTSRRILSGGEGSRAGNGRKSSKGVISGKDPQRVTSPDSTGETQGVSHILLLSNPRHSHSCLRVFPGKNRCRSGLRKQITPNTLVHTNSKEGSEGSGQSSDVTHVPTGLRTDCV